MGLRRRPVLVTHLEAQLGADGRLAQCAAGSAITVHRRAGLGPQPDWVIARLLLDGCCHWAQQERLGQVSELPRQFLAELPDVG
jgi:hypothetical protein